MRIFLLMMCFAVSPAVYADICRWECRWITIDGIPAYECKLICEAPDEDFLDPSPDIDPPLPGGEAGQCKGYIKEKQFRMYDDNGNAEDVPSLGKWTNKFKLNVHLSQYFAEISGTLTYTTGPNKNATQTLRTGDNIVDFQTDGHDRVGTWSYNATATVDCNTSQHIKQVTPLNHSMTMYPSTRIVEIADTPYHVSELSASEYTPALLDQVLCGSTDRTLGDKGEITYKWKASSHIASLVDVEVGADHKKSYDYSKTIPAGRRAWLWKRKYYANFNVTSYGYEFDGQQTPTITEGTIEKEFEELEDTEEVCNQ
ncbi:MAG: hypothetical protein QNK37_11255 [Acidobacteriota bacterium]|nr:hypothetical protein [Acidobacteriota bacterium]